MVAEAVEAVDKAVVAGTSTGMHIPWLDPVTPSMESMCPTPLVTLPPMNMLDLAPMAEGMYKPKGPGLGVEAKAEAEAVAEAEAETPTLLPSRLESMPLKLPPTMGTLL